MKFNDRDIYEALIAQDGDGIIAISLVDDPAVERPFVCFKKEEEFVRFSVSNENEHLVSGVIMLADVPIYRRDGDYEYYITYSKETIKKMANKMLIDGTFNNIDIQHNGKLINGISLQELYIKDSSKGISPNFVNDVPDGSLMGTFYVEDENLFNEMKNGNMLNGFSLEGLFTVQKLNKINNKFNKNKDMNIIAKLMKKMMKFAEISTDKGVILIADGDEIAVGNDVFVADENGEWIEAVDGEYKLDDERVIVVSEGKISEIRESEKEDEAEVEEVIDAEEEVEVIEPAPEERDEKDERIEKLEGEVSELKAKIAELEGKVEAIIAEPAAEPIVEEFEKVKEIPETKNKAARLFSSLKK